jgi:uncharacterized protein YecE (DUF72 family)
MSESWAKRTPDRFLFTVKAWARFTHDRESKNVDPSRAG